MQLTDDGTALCALTDQQLSEGQVTLQKRMIHHGPKLAQTERQDVDLGPSYLAMNAGGFFQYANGQLHWWKNI